MTRVCRDWERSARIASVMAPESRESRVWLWKSATSTRSTSDAPAGVRRVASAPASTSAATTSPAVRHLCCTYHGVREDGGVPKEIAGGSETAGCVGIADAAGRSTCVTARAGAARIATASASVSFDGSASYSRSIRSAKLLYMRSAPARSSWFESAIISARTRGSSSGASWHACIAHRTSAARSPDRFASSASLAAACAARAHRRVRIRSTHCSNSGDASDTKTASRNAP